MNIINIKRLINKIFGYLSNIDLGILNVIFIKLYVFIYKININEYEKSISEYKSFNDFFYRKLKKDARLINKNINIIVSPVDGYITQIGKINNGNFLIKNKYYDTKILFSKNKFLYNLFKNGKYLTIYLSPKNYHRIHMSYDGLLKYMIYVPGNLYSVNPNYNKYNKSLLYNERILCLFEYKFGFMLKILIGSIIVGGIDTIWQNINYLKYRNKIKIWNYNNLDKNKYFFNKGDEIAKFKIGSTVILMLTKFNMNFSNTILKDNNILLGQEIINVLN